MKKIVLIVFMFLMISSFAFSKEGDVSEDALCGIALEMKQQVLAYKDIYDNFIYPDLDNKLDELYNDCLKSKNVDAINDFLTVLKEYYTYEVIGKGNFVVPGILNLGELDKVPGFKTGFSNLVKKCNEVEYYSLEDDTPCRDLAVATNLLLSNYQEKIDSDMFAGISAENLLPSLIDNLPKSAFFQIYLTMLPYFEKEEVSAAGINVYDRSEFAEPFTIAVGIAAVVGFGVYWFGAKTVTYADNVRIYTSLPKLKEVVERENPIVPQVESSYVVFTREIEPPQYEIAKQNLIDIKAQNDIAAKQVFDEYLDGCINGDYPKYAYLEENGSQKFLWNSPFCNSAIDAYLGYKFKGLVGKDRPYELLDLYKKSYTYHYFNKSCLKEVEFVPIVTSRVNAYIDLAKPTHYVELYSAEGVPCFTFYGRIMNAVASKTVVVPKDYLESYFTDLALNEFGSVKDEIFCYDKQDIMEIDGVVKNKIIQNFSVYINDLGEVWDREPHGNLYKCYVSADCISDGLPGECNKIVNKNLGMINLDLTRNIKVES